MPIAEIFLTAFITVLFEKLASADLLGFARQQGIHTQLHKWRQTLSQIKALLNDAEEKQFADTAVKEWLEELRDLAYDLDDILDKISTEASIRNLKAARRDQASTSTKVIMRFTSKLPTCCTNFPTPRSFMFDRKMMSEIDEISTRLEDIFNQKSLLGLEGIIVKGTDQRVQLTSVVDESLVFGRDNDKGKIVEMLLKAHHEEANPPEEVFSVIPIVGMGGVGKTTLAQLVYNDQQVNNSFDLKAWVCVSDEFDVLAITKTMLESVAPDSRASSDLNQLQVSLKEKLSKKRFLLVLDDVWNRKYEKWDLLCGPLRAAAPGSKIIVTTRDELVASTMSRVPSYPLDVLEDDDCLSLLSQHALGRSNFDEHLNLKVIGEAIVRNCKGLPLAAKALGGLLRTDLSPKYWNEIMTSKIWDITEGECDILPPLRLSYNHLPSRLKQLFAYCSIFPYDYVFDRDELVLLWMAEGFLEQSEGGKSKEELGCDCFKELLSRSFFQRSRESESEFVMHDRMNDLAQVIAGNLSFRLDSNLKQNKVSEKARHSSFIRQEYEVFKKFQAFHGVKGLRTFLPLPVRKPDWPSTLHLSNAVLTDLLPKLLCLRVLSLSGYEISEIPESIGDLKRLRYLNLSHTEIESLPESVTELYNLQTLLLRGCEGLTKLPTGIGNLSNLRHLDCMGSGIIKEFPAGIGKLTSLRTLSKIVLGKVSGLKVNELKSLSNIHGTLTMVGLDTIGNSKDAKEANLSSKHELDKVVMAWSEIFDDSRDESLEKEVFHVLKPHRNLKKLKITYYGGREFPRWVGDTSFSSLVQLKLGSCKNCTSLPSLGQLPLLKNLKIGGMIGVKSVGAEFYGAGCPPTVAFPSLETLTFDGMPNWEEWSSLTGVELLPRLSELRMSDCLRLTRISISKLPSLRVLSLENCPEIVLRYLIGIASLTTLTIGAVSGLTELQKETVHLLGALESFNINRCSEMTSLWQEEGAWKDLINLKKLEVWSCEQLVSLAGDSGALPRNLESLSISKCPNLEKLPSGLNTLKFLQDFVVDYCPNILCFPDGGLPPMLTKLEIIGCEALEVRRCNNEGVMMQSNCGAINSENDAEESNNHEETKKISHLETLSIMYCSSLTSFPIGDLPSTLKKVGVYHCKKLETDVEKPLHNCMSSLESLVIIDWLNFKTFPECLFNFLHLTQLKIWNCPGLESFPECGLPRNLRLLDLRDCENLKLLPDQMHSLTSLEKLVIFGCPRLDYFPQGGFPLNLKALRLGDIGVPISEWGLQRVSSLDSFSIWGKCPDVVCFPGECLLPTSLRSLSIHDAVNLESLSIGVQDLPSLEELRVCDCPKLQSLPNTLLPTSLRSLNIRGAVNLESLSIGVQDLPSFEKLFVENCPKLQSLPNPLLSTLSRLEIRECPLLEPRCLKEGGDYWPLIAPIPCVEIRS